MVGFLELPSVIRRRIYCDAGLVTDGRIKVLNPTESETRHADEPWRWTTTDLDFSLGLFLTCRAINAEASALFFSRNQFVVGPMPHRTWAAGTLEPLRSLVRSSRGQLRSLVVDLNVVRRSRMIGQSDHSRPLDSPPNSPISSLGDWPLTSLSSCKLAEWLDMAKTTGPLVKPHCIDLSFSCDVTNVEAAEAIAASLGHFPTLRCCNLRLSYTPHAQIQGIVEHAVMRAVERASSPSSPFRFANLPRELRQEILEYTDLITPLKEVEWNPKDGYYLRYRTGPGCNRPYEPWCPVETCPPADEWVPHRRVPCDKDLYHYSCQFRNCWQDPGNRGCFCRRYHAAYSASSSGRQCACWMPPQPLFLVCRQLYEDAQYVFFSHNRIIITPPGGLWPQSSDPIVESDMYPASVFLRSALPPSSLHYLRFLDIVFLPVNQEPGNDDQAFLDWEQTVEWAAGKLNLPQLTLRIEIADYYGRKLVPEFRRKPSSKGFRQIIAGYMAMLRPLETLGSPALRATRSGGEGGVHQDVSGGISERRGLCRLFAHLARPFPSIDTGKWQAYGCEEMVERRVMGKEYDGEKTGKWDVKQAEWNWEIYYRYLEGED